MNYMNKVYRYRRGRTYLSAILPPPYMSLPTRDRTIFVIQGDTISFKVKMAPRYRDCEYVPGTVKISLSDGVLESPVLWGGSDTALSLFRDKVYTVTLPQEFTDTLREGSYNISVSAKFSPEGVDESFRETVAAGFITVESASVSPHRAYPKGEDAYEDYVEEGDVTDGE